MISISLSSDSHRTVLAKRLQKRFVISVGYAQDAQRCFGILPLHRMATMTIRGRLRAGDSRAFPDYLTELQDEISRALEDYAAVEMEDSISEERYQAVREEKRAKGTLRPRDTEPLAGRRDGKKGARRSRKTGGRVPS